MKKTAKKKEVTPWQDPNLKRRSIKTRGDVMGAHGWRGGRGPGGRGRGDDDGGNGFSAPEPVVHEVLVPETITVGALAQKMSIKVVWAGPESRKTVHWLCWCNLPLTV